MSDPRDDLAALIWEAMPDPGDGIDESTGHVIADAIIAAGWVRCLHKNSSGFSNNNGPWEMRCADCGKEWTR